MIYHVTRLQRASLLLVQYLKIERGGVLLSFLGASLCAIQAEDTLPTPLRWYQQVLLAPSY